MSINIAWNGQTYVLPSPNDRGWATAVISLLRDLATYAASALITATGTTTARSLPNRFAEWVNVDDFGAVGNGTTDDYAAFAAAKALADVTGGGLRGISGKTYRLNSSISLRNRALDFPASSFVMGTTAMLTLGGNASSAFNPTQSIGSVTRSGGMTSTPTVRFMGAKYQTFHIPNCDYGQLYADGSTTADYSIAYNHFFIGRWTKLEITNNPASSYAASATSWANENHFHGGRLNTVIIGGGDGYEHNHNIFHGMSLEGSTGSPALLNILHGNSNLFRSLRAESANAGAVVIQFAALTTYQNRINVTYDPNKTRPYDANGLLRTTVTDPNGLNYVEYEAAMTQQRIPIVVVNDTTCRSFSNVSGGTSNGRGPNVTTLRGVDVQAYGANSFSRNNNRLVFESQLIPVRAGEALAFEADVALFRPRWKCYDANRALITSATHMDNTSDSANNWYGQDLVFDDTDDLLKSNSNLASWFIVIANPTIAFVKCDIVTGGSTTGVKFRRFSLHKITSRIHADIHAEALAMGAQHAGVTASPTIGWASEVGTPVKKAAGGWFTATAALKTALSVAGIGTDLTVTLADVTGLATGAVIGIELDSGAWHWTTVNGAPVGSVVTLLVALPSAAAIGREVVANSWLADATPGASVCSSYTRTTSQSIPNATTTVVDFATKDFDEPGADNVVTGASWAFTVPAAGDGKYNISSLVTFNVTVPGTAGELSLHVYKNGSEYRRVCTLNGPYAEDASLNGTCLLNLSAGDVIDIRVTQSTGGSMSLLGTGARNFVDIHRVPGT